MKYNQSEIKNIRLIYESIKNDIVKRIKEFKDIWKNANDKQLFAEFVFCLLTPQSKALVCWDAVKNLIDKNLLLSDDQLLISQAIRNVRFMNNKAKYIITARKKYYADNKFILKQIINGIPDNIKRRNFLVSDVLGMGFKEASHFLRNVGFGSDIAILDRHILKNMVKLKIINEIPKTISGKNYLDIENKLLKFSDEIKISPDHLDFVLWYKEAKAVFK